MILTGIDQYAKQDDDETWHYPIEEDGELLGGEDEEVTETERPRPKTNTEDTHGAFWESFRGSSW